MDAAVQLILSRKSERRLRSYHHPCRVESSGRNNLPKNFKENIVTNLMVSNMANNAVDSATIQQASPLVNTATLVAVIELLVFPEFDNAFLVESYEMAGGTGTPTAKELDDMSTLLILKNREVAAPLIQQLPEAIRKRYTD